MFHYCEVPHLNENIMNKMRALLGEQNFACDVLEGSVPLDICLSCYIIKELRGNVRCAQQKRCERPDL